MLEKALMCPLWKNEHWSKNKQKKRGRGVGGVIKVGDAITWSRGNAHATGRCVLPQPVNVICTVPCNVPATFYATVLDTLAS